MLVFISYENKMIWSHLSYENEIILSQEIDHKLLIDPLTPRGNFVHHDFLKQHHIRSTMTYVGHLTVGLHRVTAILTTVP